MENQNQIQIAPNTPIWGVVQLLTHISENGSQYPTDWGVQIAQNPNSGYIYAYSECWSHCLVASIDSETPNRHYFLNSSGVEFFDYEAVDAVEFFELDSDDQTQYLQILEEIGEDDLYHTLNQILEVQ
jgi:hypothetical protein